MRQRVFAGVEGSEGAAEASGEMGAWQEDRLAAGLVGGEAQQ